MAFGYIEKRVTVCELIKLTHTIPATCMGTAYIYVYNTYVYASAERHSLMLTIAACNLWCTNGCVLGSISSKEAEVRREGHFGEILKAVILRKEALTMLQNTHLTECA